jgi:hypothetical protein
MKSSLLIRALLVGAVLAVCGCSSMDDYTGPNTLIPARTLDVSPSLHIPAEGIVAAGIVWFIVDPLAPNWKVEVTSLGQRRYALELTMKRFITGGEGESTAVVRRTAEKLRKEGGFSQYAILELSEGIESRVPIAQRVAHAVIEVL